MDFTSVSRSCEWSSSALNQRRKKNVVPLKTTLRVEEQERRRRTLLDPSGWSRSLGYQPREKGTRLIATEGTTEERRRGGEGMVATRRNSICELLVRRRGSLGHGWCLNKLYTCNLTQILGSKWGLTRGRKGKEKVEEETVKEDEEEVEEGGPEGSSEADKQNITARVTRKDPEEMKGLWLSLSLSLSFSFLSAAISFKKKEKEEGVPSWSMNGLRRAVFIHSLLSGLETHKKCISRSERWRSQWRRPWSRPSRLAAPVFLLVALWLCLPCLRNAPSRSTDSNWGCC